LPLVLLGLLVGGLLLRWNQQTRSRLLLAGGIVVAGLLLLAAFAHLAGEPLRPVLVEVGRNHGKHPPGLLFSLFSVGGALVLLGLGVAGGNLLARWLRPLAVGGSASLMAFIVHISVIFLLLRSVLGYYQAVSYEYALLLSGGLVVVTAAWIGSWKAMRTRIRQARAQDGDGRAA